MPTYYVDPVNGNDANDGGGWWKLAFASGTGAQPISGETVAGAGGAAALVIKITGTWATSGTLYLYGRNATAFANGEAITFSGGGACVNAQGTPYDSVVASFKTIKKTFAAGDTINVAKSPETAAAGTVTATLGSVSVATTNDLTGVCPQYTVIRISGDNTLYMVKAISSSAITLYRPYRGVTASGKSLTYFTGLPTSSGSDWNPTAMVGTLASPITLQAGINSSNNTQDGFTVLYGNNTAMLFAGTWTFVNGTRIATLYWGYPWAATFNDCTLNILSFRNTTQCGSAVWNRTTVDVVCELGQWGKGIALKGCTINSLETAEVALPGWNATSTIYDCLVNHWKNAGYIGGAAIDFTSNIADTRFVDPILDELASGCVNILIHSPVFISNVVFQNPVCGAGAVFSLAGGYSPQGQLRLNNINGSATDHRTFIGFLEASKYYILSSDVATYRTAAPSAKVSLFQSVYPLIIRHYIPCNAGVAKTVSVYFRKNSSYGSITLPTMRLRWMTGSAGALVSNVHDEVMANTNDSFLQCSYAVTPSVQGAIIVELVFQSANAGAIAWYDDIGVV